MLETGVALDDKKTFQFFPTPAELAGIVVARACVDGQTVLEPSAGQGALARKCIQEGAQMLTMIEINPEHQAALYEIGGYEGRLVFADFLLLTPTTISLGPCAQFDRVVMNPPFTKGQDLKHIAHAFHHWLKPGGRLVSIMLPHE